LMRPKKPALEQRSDPMEPRHDFMSLLAAPPDIGRMVPIASGCQSRVAFPAVGVNQGAGLSFFMTGPMKEETFRCWERAIIPTSFSMSKTSVKQSTDAQLWLPTA